MIAIIQTALLILGTLTSTYTDIRTGYIYDWITYPLILAGFILAIVSQQWTNLIIGGGLFVVLFIAYKLGKLGGGDVKLFTAIALLNPTNDTPFLITVLLSAAISAVLFYSIYYTLKYARKGINLTENKESIKKALLVGGMLLVYVAFATTSGIMPLLSVLTLSIPLFFGLLFMALQQGISKHFFEKKILVRELEEDEVLAPGKNKEAVLKLLQGKNVIGPTEQKVLKKNGITSIYVLRSLPPFGPFICIGVLIGVLAPQALLFLFMY